MAVIFKEQIAEYEETMPDLLSKMDYQALSKVAHKAKSSVAIMGMSDDAARLKTLELKAKEEIDVETFDDIIDSFLKNARLALEELEGYLS